MLGLALSMLLGAPWSEPVRGAVETSCVVAFSDEEKPAAYCACFVREVEGRVTEEEIRQYAQPEPTPVDAKVGAALKRAERVCRAEMAGALEV